MYNGAAVMKCIVMNPYLSLRQEQTVSDWTALFKIRLMHFGPYIYWTILMAILQSKGDCALFQIHVYNFFTKNIYFFKTTPVFITMQAPTI